MATAPLVPTQIETIFQAVTCSMGLNLSFAPPVDGQFPAGPAPNPNLYGVRIGWQQQGQPFCQVNEDVIALRCYEVDDEYNRIRDLTYQNTPSFTETWNYTRIWETAWTVYGPNSFDNARIIRSSLFLQGIHDQFASAELYWIPSPAAPMRIPELQDGQWWERVDFKARFNEFVTESNNPGFVESVAVNLYDQFGNAIETINIEEA
jgi:hypothetical protein